MGFNSGFKGLMRSYSPACPQADQGFRPENMTLEQIFVWILPFSPVATMLHTHIAFICYQRCVI